MKNHIIKMLCILCILLAPSVLFFGCSLGSDSTSKGEKKVGIFDSNSQEIKIYFTKSKGPGEIALVPVARKISKDDSLVYASVKELFLGPTKSEELKKIMTEIPLGTRLINIEESGDEIYLNISSQYIAGGGSATMQLRYLQIYKTLKKIAPFKEVYLLVDGKPVKTIGGEGLEVTQPLTKINDYTQKFEKTEGLQP